jgi:DNA mismatch repair ATPase MutS
VLLDTATLTDLDVVSNPAPGGLTLLSLLDRTRTRMGREYLRRAVTSPFGSADGILARQDAHRALAADASAYGEILGHADLDAVERYLGSTWQLPRARRGLTRLARYRRPFWYRQYLTDVRTAYTRVSGLLAVADELRGRLTASAATVLRDTGAVLALQLDTREARELRAGTAPRSAASDEAFDQLARGDAQPILSAIVETIAAVEAMWSLGVAAAERRWSYPRPASSLRVRGLVHPFLGDDGVPNDLELTGVRVCFVTGPNMAGKSTFLKAVAGALLLAHCGCAVPAEAMEFPVAGALFSSIQISDNLAAGESFYLAEVRRIRALATALQTHGSALAVVDEPFRGTNVHDAAEATLAVMTRLVAHPGALVFLASHLAEIVPALGSDPRIRLVHFSADVSGAQPRFDYRLRQGTSTQRLGMTLLRQEQVLELLEGVPVADEAWAQR